MSNKRLNSFIVDFIFLGFFLQIICSSNMNFFKIENKSDLFIKILLLLVSIIYFSIRGPYFSLGNRLNNLTIVDRNNNKVVKFKKLFKRNLINILTFPVTIIVFAFKSQTIGDYIFNTCICSNLEYKIENDEMDNKYYTIFLIIMFILSLIIFFLVNIQSFIES